MIEKILAMRGLGGGASSWNDLNDKPFGTEVTETYGDTLTWDGNTDGLYCAGSHPEAPSYRIYKISDTTPMVADMNNGVGVIHTTSGGETRTSIPISITGFTKDGTMLAGAIEHPASDIAIATQSLWAVCYEENSIYFGVNLAEKGVYICKAEGEEYINSLTIPNYTGFKTTTTTLKPIDTKYLPEHLQFGEEKDFEPISFVLDGNYDDVETFIMPNGQVWVKLYNKYVRKEAIESLSLTYNGTTETIASDSITEHEYGWIASIFASADGSETGELPEGIWVMDAFKIVQTSVTANINPKVTLTKLDKKYLPDGIGGGAEIIDAEINPDVSLGFTLPQSQSQIYEKVSAGKQVTVKGSVDGTDILFFRPCLINKTFVTFYATNIQGDFRSSSVEFFAFHLWADGTESFGADLVRVTNFVS